MKDSITRQALVLLALVLSVRDAAADAGRIRHEEALAVPPVTIGVLLATNGPEAAEAAGIHRGAALAAQECAERGRACPLVAAAGSGKWDAGAGALVRLVYSDGIRAMLGPADGRTAHLAEQVVARAKGRFVLLTPWVSDPTLTRIRVPWFFRLVPDDRQQAEALLNEIHGRRKYRTIAALVADSNYDCRMAWETFDKAARAGKMPAPTKIAVDTEADGNRLVAAVTASRAEAVLLLAPADVAAQFARQLRTAGVTAAFFGPLRLASLVFLEAAGDSVEGMVFAAPPELPTTVAERFRARYRTANGQEADVPAAYGYDGTTLLINALQSAGAGDESLRATVAATHREGVTGVLAFDQFGSRAGPAPLARVEGGRLRGISGNIGDVLQAAGNLSSLP